MSSRLAATPAGRAILTAAQTGTAGTPVYLRYAGEAVSPEYLERHAADVVAFAAEVLGEPVSLYASAVRDGAGRTVHLAISVRHGNEGVALLGVGLSHGTPRPPTLLFLGDRGALELNPASPTYAKSIPDPSELPREATSNALMDAIRRSLESGRAELFTPQAVGTDG